MDEEKNYVTLEQLRLVVRESSDRVVHLLLHEMGTRFGEVNERFDRIEQRLDRQAGLLQTGARQTVRFIGWSEKADVALQEIQKQIHSFKARVEKIEGDQAGSK